MIFRSAGTTLHQILYAADGHDWHYEEKRDEAHALFLSEITDCAAMATAHLRRFEF